MVILLMNWEKVSIRAGLVILGYSALNSLSKKLVKRRHTLSGKEVLQPRLLEAVGLALLTPLENIISGFDVVPIIVLGVTVGRCVKTPKWVMLLGKFGLFLTSYSIVRSICYKYDILICT